MQRLSVPPTVETCFDPFSAIVTLLAATNLDEVWSRFNISSSEISRDFIAEEISCKY